VADVVEQVTAASGGGDAQFEAVRAFVLAELEAWPTGPGAPNGALVEMAGHSDDTSRNVTIVVRPVRIGAPED
jgi:exoribonuclease R